MELSHQFERGSQQKFNIVEKSLPRTQDNRGARTPQEYRQRKQLNLQLRSLGNIYISKS